MGRRLKIIARLGHDGLRGHFAVPMPGGGRVHAPDEVVGDLHAPGHNIDTHKVEQLLGVLPATVPVACDDELIHEPDGGRGSALRLFDQGGHG